jgi:peptidyl-prolyl cis-trans isomerase D
MLQFMRDALKGWAGKSLIILFILPFLFLGAESFFSVFQSGEIPVEVNGQEITEDQVTRAVEMNKEQIRQRFGEDFDINQLSNDALREGAMTQLVNKELNRQYVLDNNLGASFSKVSEIIRSIPAFTDETGQFSQESFETLAAQQGLTTKRIIEMVREDISVAQPREAIMLSSFSLPQETKLIKSLNSQERDIAYLQLKLASYIESIEVSDEEVKAFYDSNIFDFMTDETVSVEYVELKQSDFINEVNVSDEEVLTRFDVEREAQNSQLERKASHILVAVDDSTAEEEAFNKITNIQEQLDSGADFAELAKTLSTDKGSAKMGGDLGFAGRGSYAQEFEDALYALEKDQVSSPVLTEFGYHLIKLTDIAKAKQFSFDKEKARIKESLTTVALQDIFQEKISLLEEIVFESIDLDEAAISTGVEVKVSNQFTRREGDGIAQYEDVRKIAFSDEILISGENSTVISLGDGHVVAVKLKEHKPSIAKPFESVQSDIIASLKADYAEEELQAKQEELLAMLEQGESANTVAKASGFDWQIKEKAKRQEPDIAAEILNEAFKMPRPSSDKKSVSSISLNGDIVLITLTKVHDNTKSFDQAEIDRLNQRRTMQNANREWEKHIAFLKAKADLKYKKTDSTETELIP